jgi:hypothetical protein
MSIDKRIEKRTEAVEKAKIKYDEAVSELDSLPAEKPFEKKRS